MKDPCMIMGSNNLMKDLKIKQEHILKIFQVFLNSLIQKYLITKHYNTLENKQHFILFKISMYLKSSSKAVRINNLEFHGKSKNLKEIKLHSGFMAVTG